jgi:uncharacterized protein YjbI with pentapeptide repeats
MCDYKVKRNQKCSLEPYGNSPFCVLHIDFPEDKKCEEYQRLLELKNKKILEKVHSGDFDFTGAIIRDFPVIDNLQIYNSVLFTFAKIIGDVSFKRGTIKGDVSFQGATLYGNVDFENSIITGNVFFGQTIINGDLNFTGAAIKKTTWFQEAKINGNASFHGLRTKNANFENAIIKGNTSFKTAILETAEFEKVTMEGDVIFSLIKLKESLNFRKARLKEFRMRGGLIEGNVNFSRVRIDEIAAFDGITLMGTVNFDDAIIGGFAAFRDNLGVNYEDLVDGGYITHNEPPGFDLRGKIYGDASFQGTLFLSRLRFSDSFFQNLHAKENINRIAKRLCEERGENHDADNYFFNEMVYRREQKRWRETEGKPIKERVIKWFRYWIEWPLKNLFFYGVFPEYSFLIWISIIVFFAMIYWLGSMVETSNFAGCLYFSVTNAMTPGYGGMYPKDGWPQYIATLEAIFGTFMWASFIAILARKFSR